MLAIENDAKKQPHEERDSGKTFTIDAPFAWKPGYGTINSAVILDKSRSRKDFFQIGFVHSGPVAAIALALAAPSAAPDLAANSAKLSLVTLGFSGIGTPRTSSGRRGFLPTHEEMLTSLHQVQGIVQLPPDGDV